MNCSLGGCALDKDPFRFFWKRWFDFNAGFWRRRGFNGLKENGRHAGIRSVEGIFSEANTPRGVGTELRMPFDPNRPSNRIAELNLRIHAAYRFKLHLFHLEPSSEPITALGRAVTTLLQTPPYKYRGGYPILNNACPRTYHFPITPPSVALSKVP